MGAEIRPSPKPPRVPIALGTYWTVTICRQPRTKGTTGATVPVPDSVFHLTEVPTTCGYCGRKDAQCIFHDSQGGLAGKWEELEYHCPACGWFTLYEFED